MKSRGRKEGERQNTPQKEQPGATVHSATEAQYMYQKGISACALHLALGARVQWTERGGGPSFCFGPICSGKVKECVPRSAPSALVWQPVLDSISSRSAGRWRRPFSFPPVKGLKEKQSQTDDEYHTLSNVEMSMGAYW